MTRFSAFAIHIGISFIIFLVLAYFVVFEWYPGIFFDTDGGWRGMRIIVAVDMVLGPALTFVVYKHGKPGLRTDLTLIGILQFVCLFAGTYVVYQERPISVVYNDGRFTVMTQDDYTQDAGIDVPDLQHFPGDDPKWVLVNLPTGEEEQTTVRQQAMESGRLINSLIELYAPFETNHPLFATGAKNPIHIGELGNWQAAMDAWVNEHGGTIDDYALYTFSTRYTFGYLVYDRQTWEQLGLITEDAR